MYQEYWSQLKKTGGNTREQNLALIDELEGRGNLSPGSSDSEVRFEAESQLWRKYRARLDTLRRWPSLRGSLVNYRYSV